MKQHQAVLLCFAFGLVAGATAIALTRKPCPTPDTPPPSVEAVRREILRDSIAERRAIRDQILDSINANPITRDINIRTARSLGRRAQLDSLLADPR